MYMDIVSLSRLFGYRMNLCCEWMLTKFHGASLTFHWIATHDKLYMYECTLHRKPCYIAMVKRAGSVFGKQHGAKERLNWRKKKKKTERCHTARGQNKVQTNVYIWCKQQIKWLHGLQKEYAAKSLHWKNHFVWGSMKAESGKCKELKWNLLFFCFVVERTVKLW